MKKTTLLTAILVLSLLRVDQANAQYTDLLSLSDPAGFGPVLATTFTGTGSQTASGWEVNGGISNGDLIFGEIPTSQDWSSLFTPGVSSFGIFVNIVSLSDNIPLSLEILDSTYSTIDTWSSVTGSVPFNGYINFGLAPNVPGTGDYSDVKGVIITWANASPETIDTTISTVSVVPEPSTYALLALSGLALGGYAMRRRRRA